MTLKENLVTRAQAYCKANKIALSTLSSRIANDGKILGRLVEGRRISTDRYEILIAKLDDLESEAA